MTMCTSYASMMTRTTNEARCCLLSASSFRNATKTTSSSSSSSSSSFTRGGRGGKKTSVFCIGNNNNDTTIITISASSSKASSSSAKGGKKRITKIRNQHRGDDDDHAFSEESEKNNAKMKGGALFSTAVSVVVVLSTSQSVFNVQPAYATFSKSQFEILCPVGDEGTECRMKALAEDKGAYLNDAEYNTKSDKKKSMKTSAAATAGRNTDLTAYQADTLALADAMDELFAMDLYSTAREPAIKQLQKKANDWTGRYCPGGSSKQASGRSMYNAVNQLLGHFANNGLAPLPSARVEIVNKNIATARDLIAQGR